MGLHGTSWDFMGLSRLSRLSSFVSTVFRCQVLPLQGSGSCRQLLGTIGLQLSVIWFRIKDQILTSGKNPAVYQPPSQHPEKGTVWNSMENSVNMCQPSCRPCGNIILTLPQYPAQQPHRPKICDIHHTTETPQQDLCFLQDNLEHLKNMQPTFRHMHVCVCACQREFTFQIQKSIALHTPCAKCWRYRGRSRYYVALRTGK